MKVCNYLPLLLELKIYCLLKIEIRFLESKSTLPQRKNLSVSQKECNIWLRKNCKVRLNTEQFHLQLRSADEINYEPKIKLFIAMIALK